MYKQKSLTHRILAMLLAIVMMVGYLPTAWAASDSVKASFTADAASLGSASDEMTTATLKISVPKSEITSRGSITLEYQIDSATPVSKTAVIKSDLDLDTAHTDTGWTQTISSYVYIETIHNVPARTEKVTEYEVSYTHPGWGIGPTIDVLATDSVRMEPVPVKPVISLSTFSPNIKLGETFTATATSDVGSGYITFEYDGLQRKALVDSVSKTATASFIAVDGATKVTAYQHSMGSGYVDSDSKTETITATALPALTISELKVTDPSSGSVTEGERFTVTATTNVAGGRVAFEYDGVKKTAAVNGNTASASFDAVYGVTEVSAYQYGVTGHADSDTVTVDVTVEEFTKSATTTEIDLNTTSTGTITAGQTLIATATVKDSSDNAIDDAVGTYVKFTWPDNTASLAPIDSHGKAVATWVVTDAYANGLTMTTRNKTVGAEYQGSEKYNVSTETYKPVEIYCRTIKPQAGAQITANLAGTSTAATTPLSVKTAYDLSVNPSALVQSEQGVSLAQITDFTVAWYKNDGRGNWSALASPDGVTPENANVQYKVVVTPTGDYELGEFELVIGCQSADTTTTLSPSATSIYEGQTVVLTADVTDSADQSVSGGEVEFYTADSAIRGRAPVVNGKAVLRVSDLPAGSYTVNARYMGTTDVFNPSDATAVIFDVTSATLPVTDWSIQIKVGGVDKTHLVVGSENKLSIVAPFSISANDFRTEWLLSKDGGATWALVEESADEITVTPKSGLYQYRAIVYPDGNYTKPVNGIGVSKVTAELDGGKIKTAISLSAYENEVFENEPFTLIATVTELTGGVPVTGGTVTLNDGTNDFATIPVDAVGMVVYQVIGGVDANTTFKATYNDNDIYKESTSANVIVTVKTREIELKTGADTITTSDTIAVGRTVTLTAPDVYAKGTTTPALTAGTHFYYQWQYCDDYAGTTDYTAIWKNFSAPGSDNGKTARVTIATANTAFRVIAVPYGDYRYPAQGVMTEPVCGNSPKITPSVKEPTVTSLDHDATIYDGDEVLISTRVTAGGKAVTEGLVSFQIGTRTIGTAVVDGNGYATMTYTANLDQMSKVHAVYNGTARYEKVPSADTTVTIKQVKIKVATKIQRPTSGLTVGKTVDIAVPTAADMSGIPLELGKDYYIEWFEDHGYGWSSKMLMYSGLNYTFTPQNENSKLAAIVRPMGNYSLPAEGVSAGVLSDAAKINTKTTLATSVDPAAGTEPGSAYEGDEITLTATIQAGGNKVLDGKVDFYAKVGNATDSVCIGSASVNGEGKAILTYTLPSYATLTSSKDVVFSAKYLGTDAYAASEATATDSKKVTVKSATIAFGTNPAITIELGAGETQPAVGKSYKLTAPDVYEQGNLTTPLTCGTHYYYVWDRSTDGGVTWETVQSTTDVNSYILNNAVFLNDQTEFRATAYPITGSGSHYRYPVTGITVMTNTTPTTKATTATVTLSNEYAKSGDVAIYPVGRDIVVKATVVTDDTDKAPATGKVTFHQKGSTDVEIGSAFLNPVGEAEITIPAPATAGEYVYYVKYAGNEVFTTVNSDASTVNAAVLPNTIKMAGTLKLTDTSNNNVAKPVVGEKYKLSGAYATVDTTSLTTYVDAANDKLPTDPYFYYQWQKSEDGGETWVSLDNPVASRDTPSLEVTFDTDLTQYRLAAYPIASTGWINPTTGVTSKAKGVGTTATTTAITLKDKATGETLTSGSEISEGRTVLVTVNVSGIADYTPGTDGWVKLSTYAKKAAGTSVALDTQTAKVMNDGNVTFDVVLPAYSYKFATRMNEIFFDAEFSGDNHFKDSNSVGDAKLNLLSAAIAWNVVASGASADSVRTITIYKGTTIDDSTKLATSESMVANQDYTLKLPTIMAADVDKITGDRVSAPRKLTNGVEYTVDWQRQLKGGATQTGWQTIPTGNGGDTLYIAADAGAQDYSYRAVVTPMGDYEFAMNNTFGTLNPTNTLTTAETADTKLAETTTTLEVKDVIAEAANVKINGETPFDSIHAHNTQYEGENVTLTATVKAGTQLVDDGYVDFYRNGKKINETSIKLSNGAASMTIPTSAFAGTAVNSKDTYYAKYLGTDVYKTSDSQADPQIVYIRSTSIAVPRIGATAFDGSSTPAPKWTTKSAGASVQSATNLTFKLMTDAANGNDTDGWSVTAKDGRWLKSGTDFTTTWHLNETVLDGAGSITGLPAPLGEGDTWKLNNGDFGQQYFAFLKPIGKPIGHMTVGAKSQNIKIGELHDPISTSLMPEITFNAPANKLAASVTATKGSHYGDEITLTAYVQGEDVCPTGTVDFYYVAEAANGTQSNKKINTDPVHLTAKGTTGADAKIATASIDTTVLPLNTKAVFFTYSGDRNYNAVTADKKEYKVWSVQISNPAREGGQALEDKLSGGTYTPNFTDPACYPDRKSYGNVEIKAYKARANTEGIFSPTGSALPADDALKANGDYILKLQPIYTKNGEKLIPKMDNSGDVSIEWLASTDEGNTWSPVQVTELSDAEALTVYVKPADKDTRYAVKVTTNNSFYNSQKPELVDYEYSADVVAVQTQDVIVKVTAQAETPVNGKNAWVYQKNPITLFAEVSPSIKNSGEPTGTVEFYYTEYRSDGNYSDTDIWKPVVSDTEDKSNTANLVKTTSATDTAGKMVASLTTSELPVSADGTYSNLVIKAIYRGDQTYRVSDNINGTTSINSEIVSVFSSVIYQQDTIENVEGVPAADKKGVIIRAKALKSDGTPANLELDPVYTLDVLDSSILSNDSIYKLLTDGSEYTVEWQYCADYAAYQSYLNGTDPEGRNWTTIPNSSSNDCSVEQIQGYAFRAKITAKDMPKTKAAYLNAQDVPVKGCQVIYSNILVVGDAEARVFNNIRKASSASKRGDTVSIDTFVMGGSTTPVGSTTVTVTETGTEGGADIETVFTDTKNLANGYVTRDWTNVQPGIYKIKTELQSNNGYTGETVENYIVRFTNSELKINVNVTDPAPTYDGQIKSAAASITGFGNYVGGAYENLKAKAESSIVFQYYKDGQRVAEPVDAGTYTVKAYLPESKYWGYVEAEGTLTIQKREVTITDVIAQAKTYDGEKTANVQTVTLNQSAINGTTGLPTGSTGVIEGDSVYVQATAAFNSKNVTEANTLTLTSATLAGPHKDNYVLTNPNYSEAASIARNQLTASAYSVIKEKPGYKLTDADFKMVDQQGNALTIENGQADITYYYHSGNDIKVSENTNRAGKYTVVIGKKSDNYKGGATVTLYVDNSLTRATEGTVTAVSSAMIDITDTYHVYDGTAKSVTVTPKVVGQTVEVSYAGMGGTYSTTAPTAAGRYMVKATANGRTYYGIMTIVKGDPNASLTATTKEYTGSRYDGAPVLTEGLYESNKANDPYGDLYYSYVGGSIVGSSLNAPRDVSYVVNSYVDSETSGAYGTYVVSAHVPETANTIRKTVSAEFEITKAPLTVTAEDVYTRLFDTNSKMTSIYEGFKDGNYGEDNSIRDFIALPTYTIVGLDQESMNNVGPFVLAPSDINVRNYAVTYVNGQITINDQSTQAPLEIRSELGNDNVVYYGQKFKVSLYGSRVGAITNESSVVTYEISAGAGVAEIDASGNVKVNGVGSFTIKATRGDDERAISTTETFTAKKRANEIVIERDDYLYDGSNKSINGANYSFYYMDNGTWFKNTALAYTTSNQPKQASGIYKVTATIKDTVATEVGNGAGLLGIHRVNATVTADPKSMTYGSALPTDNDYTCSTHVGAEKALTNGVTAIDARANSDVGSYEILVAGGKEGHNYNVTYAKSDSDHDFDITAKDLNVQAGMLKDTQGETLNWRTASLNATLAGLFENIPGAVDAFQTTLDRMFGERNRVLDNKVTGLITGDSMADLLRGGQLSAFTWLASGKPLSAEAAANRKYPSRTDSITSENSTVHGNATSTITAVESGTIDGNDYVITTSFADSTLYPLNYNVTASTGTQNVYQRPVTITPKTSGILINAGTYTSTSLANAILNQAEINGLASETLLHTYRDLCLSASLPAGGMLTPGTKNVTLTIGNTNYCADGGGQTINIQIQVANMNGHLTRYEGTATGFKVRVYVNVDGQSKPAEINELRFKIVKRDDPSVVLDSGVMTRVMPNQTFNGIEQSIYETSHVNLIGMGYVKFIFEADGYNFT